MRDFQLQSNTRKSFESLRIVSGNNPMVGMTVAVAVAVAQALKK